MRNIRFKKILSLILSVALIAAAAMLFTACGTVEDDGALTKTFADGDVLGEGANVFTFTVVDAEGNAATAEIHTDKTIVGEALLDLELIEGEDSEYGLYVKTVNNLTYDYEADGYYWGFYINGDYALTGVDSTEITPDTNYTFQAESAG